MTRPAPHPLALGLGLALAAPTLAAADAGATDWALCRAPESLPMLRTSPPAGPREGRAGATLDIDADRLDVSGERETVFLGNVELQRADQWMGTDELRYQHEARTWTSPGPLRFEDEGLRLTAAKADGDDGKETVRLEDVRYQLAGDAPGNGTASTATREAAMGTLVDATYSTCPPGQRQWEFRASTIELDDEKAQGVAQNATLRVGGVPVLWLPWISFPTTDERRSGVLAPTIGYDDRNGFDVEVPYYLNLAPNYDATLYPRWMSRRGLMLGGEFRYLTARSGGEVSGSWLGNDDLTGRDRGFARWQHFTSINPHWYASALLQDVSDRAYLRDFGSDFGQNTTTLLDSTATLGGRGLGWSAELSAQRWEAANPAVLPGSEPFTRLPRLRGRWQPLGLGVFEPRVDAEAVRFDHDTLAGGRRVDIHPRLRLGFGGPSWFLRPEFGWRWTRWSLDGDPANPLRDRSPRRSLPVASLDAGMFFERPSGLFGGSIQTLEPRLYYLRVPYREQDALPLFDTQPLTFGWPGLFRDNRYAGGDRQADAHQATIAVTTRFLDGDDGRERLSASVGRIHYFDPPRVRLPGEPALPADGSAYVGEVDWRLSDAWSLSVAQQWNPGRLGTDLSAVRTQYRFGERGVVNASYRYRRDVLEQTDLSFAAPIDQHWRVVGRWAWSLREDRTLEALGGLEWRSCCVAVRMLARDYIRDLGGERNLGFYLEIELNGLGRFGRDSERLLSDGILGYTP